MLIIESYPPVIIMVFRWPEPLEAVRDPLSMMFDILMQAILPTKEATIGLDSQPEICRGTNWQKHIRLEDYFWIGTNYAQSTTG